MVATRTRTTIPQPISETTLGNSVKQKFIDLGYTLLDDYISGATRYLIYSYTFDPSKTYGTVFFKFAITGLAITQTLGTGYTVATKVFAGAGTESYGQPFQGGVNLDLLTYANGNQYKIVFVSQGTESYYVNLLGFMRPANKPAWWNEDLAPYCFINRNVDPYMAPWFLAGVRPFSAISEVSPVSFLDLQNANPITLERDIINNIPLLINSSSGRYGAVGSLPEDFCAIAASGTTKLDIIVIGQERYEFLFSSASNNCGYAMRIA